MELCGTTPCRECPWRRAAPAAWLGGFSIEWFTHRLQAQAPMACHMTVGGTGQPRLCVGFAQAMSNSCATPRDPRLAAEVRKAGKNPDVFANRLQFDAHHRTPLYERLSADLKRDD